MTAACPVLALVIWLPWVQPSPPPVEPHIIRATGIGWPRQGTTGAQARLMAQRAAQMDALAQLTAKVYGATVTKSSDATRTERQISIQGTLRGYRVLPARDLPDGSVEVTVELPLPGLMRDCADKDARIAQLERELEQARSELKNCRARLSGPHPAGY